MGTLYNGARNAVEVCMGVKPEEYVLIVTDRTTQNVGEALYRASKEVTTDVEMYVLEDYGIRPLGSVPDEIKKGVPKAKVTFWVAESVKGELEALRRPFMKLALKYARHGHMPNVNKRIMEEGMCSDYEKIAHLTETLYDLVKHAEKIEVKNSAGTEFKGECHQKWRWVKSDGIFRKKGEWGNLPDGELFTAVADLNGHIVFDELGEWFSKYGCLTPPESAVNTPVSIEVVNSRVNLKTIDCSNLQLKRELIQYLKKDENSNRAGEFALPTNIELLGNPLSGHFLQDEKAKVHLAVGDPYPMETGANWTSKTHRDGLMKQCSGWIDGKRIMKEDHYLI